jgi:hypothetical protein
MNSMSINRKVWAMTLILCLGLIGYSAFTAHATDPKTTVPVESMSPKDCHAQWTIGTNSTGWVYLGEVSGFFANKKQKCKELAQKSCNRPEVVNLVRNNVPASQACPGGIDVYFDTRVEGKTNSKDGFCRVNPGCACSQWSYK